MADADTGSREGPAAEHEGHLVEPAVWTGTTTSGLAVTVKPDPFPVRVGETEFKISFDGGVPDQTPISIDVVSPEMPAMGILRYPAETSGPGEYVARARIGMAGAWEIYVNLGDGTDSGRVGVAPAARRCLFSMTSRVKWIPIGPSSWG